MTNLTQFSKRVLVVDDDETMRFLMAEFLETLGYAYDLAKDGAECLKQLAAQPGAYFLVLMDIHMPEITGLDASRQIRAADNDPPKSVPIVAVTADVAYHSDHIALSHGMTAVLPKPVSLARLADTLETHAKGVA